MRQRVQQCGCTWQNVSLGRNGVVGEPARKSLDPAFLLCALCRDFISDFARMRVAAANDAADQGRQRLNMPGRADALEME